MSFEYKSYGLSNHLQLYVALQSILLNSKLFTQFRCKRRLFLDTSQ